MVTIQHSLMRSLYNHSTTCRFSTEANNFGPKRDQLPLSVGADLQLLASAAQAEVLRQVGLDCVVYVAEKDIARQNLKAGSTSLHPDITNFASLSIKIQIFGNIPPAPARLQ
jgi:hypothetical protein